MTIADIIKELQYLQDLAFSCANRRATQDERTALALKIGELRKKLEGHAGPPD